MKKILISSALLFVIDILWLKFYMTEKYDKMIYEIQNSKLKIDIVSAGLSYFTLCFALNYFVLPYVKTNDYRLISHSFMFGLVTYAVYDFTCGAIFENWDKKLMIIDTLWGGILYMITNYLTNMLYPSF